MIAGIFLFVSLFIMFASRVSAIVFTTSCANGTDCSEQYGWCFNDFTTCSCDDVEPVCVYDHDVSANCSIAGQGSWNCNNAQYNCSCPGGGSGSVCGNGVVESGEQCDDGGTVNGDGCTSTCQYQSSGGGGGTGPAVCTVAPNPVNSNTTYTYTAQPTQCPSGSACKYRFYHVGGGSHCRGSGVSEGQVQTLPYCYGTRTVGVYTQERLEVIDSSNNSIYNDVACPNLTVIGRPKIDLTPKIFVFTKIVGGSNAPYQNLVIQNTGDATMNWKWKRVNASGGTSPVGTWCSLQNSAGTSITINTGGTLAPSASVTTRIAVTSVSNAGTLEDCNIQIYDTSNPLASNTPQNTNLDYVIKPSNVSNVATTLASCPSRNVTVSWTAANSGTTAKTYNIYRNTTSTVPSIGYASGITASPWINTSTAVGSTYYYWVETVSGGNVSPNKIAASSNATGGVPVTSCAVVPSVTTPTHTSITSTSATLGANVTSLGQPASISARGTCWGTSPAPSTNCLAQGGTTTGVYTHSRTGLSPGTTYYYRGYATNATGTGYSASGTFATTAAPAVPTVTTPTSASITGTSATLGANVTSLGSPATISARGTCWGTTPAPTTNCVAQGGTTTGVYSHSRTGLTAGTTYYYRGYATNSTGTGYSPDGTFATLIVPTVTTPTVTSVMSTSATLGANVTSLGVPASISARGTCWGTTPAPVTNCVAQGGTTTGVFTHSRTGLTASTTYYYRGYATNTTGTGYSSDGTFTTPATETIPTVTTNAVSTITSTSAVGGGNTVSNGGATVTVAGITWSTSANPVYTVGNTATQMTDGWAIGGPWTSATMGTALSTPLTPNTLYHVRAFAVNSVGTAYGADVQFTTSAVTTVPTLTTNVVTNITSTSATSGGNITSDGGATVTVSGIVWDTIANPTTALTTKTTNGWAIGGPWSSDMTSLIPNTIYHVRAYATNSVGTAYGEDVQFTSTLSPSGSISATSCTISLGESTCDSLVSWSTSNLTGNPTEVTRNNPSNTHVSWLTSGTNVSNTVNRGASTFYIYHNSVELASSPISADCEAGLIWDGVECATSSVPTLTSPTAVSITTTDAILGANVTSLGVPASISARGTCWGAAPFPTTNCVDEGGITTGAYSHARLGFSPSTTYYYRGYAINASGVGYSPDGTFITDSSGSATINASLPIIYSGDSVTITWSCLVADTSSSGTNFSTGGAPSGSISVSPADTTTYTLTCDPSGGIDSVTVVVKKKPLFQEQ